MGSTKELSFLGERGHKNKQYCPYSYFYKMELFGVKAQIFLAYGGAIEDLSGELSKGLQLPEFYFDSDEESPHEVSGYCEALGFEVWLRKAQRSDEFSYILKMETELSLAESFNDQMHDVSPWLARFVSTICSIDTCVPDANKRGSMVFREGKLDF